MERTNLRHQQQSHRNTLTNNNHHNRHQRSRSMTPSRERSAPTAVSRRNHTPASVTPPPYLQQPLPSASCFDFSSAAAASRGSRSRLEHSSSAPDGCFANFARSTSPFSLASRRQSAGSGAPQVLLTSSSQYRSHFSDVISEWRNELQYGSASVTSQTLQRPAFPVSPRNYAHVTSPLARASNNNSVMPHGGSASGERVRSAGDSQFDRLGVTTARLSSLLVRFVSCTFTFHFRSLSSRVPFLDLVVCSQRTARIDVFICSN